MYNHTLGDTFLFRARDTTEKCTGFKRIHIWCHKNINKYGKVRNGLIIFEIWTKAIGAQRTIPSFMFSDGHEGRVTEGTLLNCILRDEGKVSRQHWGRHRIIKGAGIPIWVRDSM